MQQTLSRRAFFTGRFSQPEAEVARRPVVRPPVVRPPVVRPPVVRPPGALNEREFIQRCTGCDACRAACESHIIVQGAGGLAEVDFTVGACTFCGACVQACEAGALAPEQSLWDVKAVLGDGCLSVGGVTCRVCGEHCDAQAIRFQLAVGGIATPNVDEKKCTGCGACVAPCPTGALTLEHQVEEAFA